MSASKSKSRPKSETPPASPVPGKVSRRPPRRGPATNRLTAPDARWQRFQRYVWDKKKG